MNTTPTTFNEIAAMYVGAAPWDPSRLPSVTPDARAETERRKRQRLRAMFGEEAAPPPEDVRVEEYIQSSRTPLPTAA